MSTEPAITPNTYAAMTSRERGHNSGSSGAPTTRRTSAMASTRFILPVLAVQLTNYAKPGRRRPRHLTISWLVFALLAGSIIDRADLPPAAAGGQPGAASSCWRS